MNALRMLGTDLRVLLVTTTSVWWRLLPRLLAFYLLGFLGFQLALKLAVVVGLSSAWAALVIFSTGFIALLVSIVLTLRAVGLELGVRDLVAGEEATDDDRDSSVSRLLALTLLPFLGLYTAFGFIQQASQLLLVESIFVSGGALSVSDSILGQLRLTNAPTSKYVVVGAVIVGCYVLRRSLDQLHERTGWRPLGVLVAFVEGFFVLVALTAGADIVARFRIWLTDRALVGWLAVVGDGIGAAYRAVVAVLPAFLVTAAEYLREHAWPILLDEVTQPIIWLAVAALVFGSKVVSVAELWRKGRPLVRRADRVATVNAHRAITPTPGRTTRATRVGAELREAFLGDIDDKYLPTIQSVRLVVRAGAVFLGAYLLAYALQAALANYWKQVVNAVVGGHPAEFWFAWNPVIDLVNDLPFEPWRLCLLAVAFHRCLQIFQARAAERGAQVGGSSPALASAEAPVVATGPATHVLPVGTQSEAVR